jgi:FKBP-type peptidyl-prolyl cis-trans isomerase FklB
MKLKLLAALMLAVPLAHAAEPKLDTDEQKAAYFAGLQIGAGLQRDVGDLDIEIIKKGLTDGFKKNKPAISEEAANQAMLNYQQKRQNEATAKNGAAAKKFLLENAKKPGVVSLPSGLQYQVLTAGNGASPKRTDSVKVHYQGTLLDGQVFDSSIQRGAPATFGLGQVIPGWTEALQLMKAGDKWKLFIPPELAYGNRGMGPIPPGSLLTFEVELLEVLPPPSDKAASGK